MGRRSQEAKPGVVRSRRQDSDRLGGAHGAGGASVPGLLGLPAAPAGKPAHPRAARLARTLRTRWWPRFLLAGVLLVVVGATLLSGAAEAWVVLAGTLVLLFRGFNA